MAAKRRKRKLCNPSPFSHSFKKKKNVFNAISHVKYNIYFTHKNNNKQTAGF